MFNLLKKLFSSDNKKNTLKFTKVIENDKDIENIITNFKDRKNEKHNELRKRFGTEPSENDTLWGLLQDLYLESFLKNHYLLLNVEYHRGLLLQKEKKYKDAISHYVYGLYYLLNVFIYPFDPNRSKMNIDGEEFYHAQQKFSNKIIICINNGRLNAEEFFSVATHLLNTIDFNINISIDNFLKDLSLYLEDNFYDINLAENINFNNIESTKITFYASKLRNLVKDLIKKNDNERIIKTLNTLYLIGCFYEYLFGNYVSVGWTHDLANAKKKFFNPSEYTYNGYKIKYKTNREYHNQFTKEYEKIFNRKLNYEFVNFSSDGLLSKKDYELFDKYLLKLDQ